MRRSGRTDQALRGTIAAVLVTFLAFAAAETAWAQQRIAGSAELRRLTGQVEILRKGQTQWTPAVVGARLQAGDDMRAYGGSSAELLLADGSTLLLAENSRVFVTKLDVDTQNQTRDAWFHLVVGKAKAVVTQAAITLVRARQSNFNISTPSAVAAARGTVFVVIYNDQLQQMTLAVLVEDPNKPSIVTCIPLTDRSTTSQVRSGLSAVATTRGCRPPTPITDPDIDTPNNPMPLGQAFFGPANPVIPFSLPNFGGIEGVQFSSGPDLLASFPPAPFNRDVFIDQNLQVQSGLTNPTNP